MRSRSLFSLILILAFLSCNRNIVNLDYTNAKDEVPTLGNLIFRFDKALVKDSLLNKWDSTEFVSFTPAIAGRFRWESPDQLVFSPSKPLPPATSFKATLKSDILQYSAFDKIGKSDKILFTTPSLKLDNTNITWVLTDESSNSALPQVDIYFNYPVDPASLKNKLSINIDDKPVTYQVNTLSPDSKISVRLNGLKLQEKDVSASLVVQKGILPQGGNNATETELRSELLIPSPFNLTVNEITTEHNGTGGEIYVRTSQQVIADRLSSLLKITPSLKFNTELTEDGFVIRSEQFDVEKTYVLDVQEGLRGRIGGVLREPYSNNISFGELEPSISFVNSKAVYLSGAGNQQIEMRIVNVPKIKVVISKIYESNLLLAQRYGYYPKDDRRDEDYYGDEYESNSPDLGDIVYEKEIDTRSLPKYGNSRLLKFNVEDRLADFKGIYHIKIRSDKDYWLSDSRFISKSDIGLIAKEGKDKLYVFANSLQTAMAMPGVNVVVYGKNNQVLGVGATKEDGVAEIAYTRKEFAGFRPAMVIAKTEADFNYLPFSNTRVNISRFETGGKTLNQTGLDAYIYAERDIYRPGERVNFSVITRDANWKSPGELPVILRFLLPNGKELKTFRKTLNEQGSVAGDVDLSVSAITGSYTLELYSSTEVLLASKNFSVEEFVPDRIKVTAKLDRPILAPAEPVMLSINAVNFFGPAAANRNYEAEIQVKSKYFQVKNFSGFNFSILNQGVSNEKVLREGKTDESGNARETYLVPGIFKNMGLLQANFYATVFDETGRPVSRMVSADIFTQQQFFGISDDGYSYYPLNQPIRFPVLAVDKDQRVLNGAKAQVKIIKHEYRTVLSKAGSYFRYESQADDKLLTDQEILISDEKTNYSFTPRSPGNYELRLYVPGANSYVSKSFYSYGSWGNNNSSFEVNTEGNIDISLDKSGYQPGESVKALFKAPFNGRMLVTLETDKVLSYQYVEVSNRTASLDLKMTEAHMPNVYITASLIKPHTQSDIPLTAAHGFQSVKVDARSRIIPVEIVAAKSARSKTHQKVTVKAAPGSYITLAAVDNGVLQVTGFPTPDPYGHFYAKKALEVNAFDMYPLLFPELKANLSSTGGDGDLSMDKRTNPMPAKRIKVVSYWSGISKSNSNGESSFEFDVPQFSGEIRLMAVAYKDDQFGSKASAMTIADPLVLSSSLPRFLSPNDTVTMPVTITNTTGKAATVNASLQVSGPLKVVGSNGQTLNLTANSETRAVFQVVASPSVATGKIRLEVQGMGEKFNEETEIGVRPAAPLQISTGSGSLNGATSETITIPTKDFLPGTSDYQLVVSRNPALELGRQFRYLLQYPYGCTEQSISAAFPQLYYGDITEQLLGKSSASTNAKANANYNVGEAIRKIKLRQLYNGGVTLWDGEGRDNWWTSIYAAHFLLEARKAGFETDKKLLDGLLLYTNAKLKNKQTITYYYNQKEKKKIAPREVAYALYVLALAGQPNVSVMNYYKANPALLSLDSKYLLSVAYAVGGDKAKFRELLPGSFSGEIAMPETGGSFSSDIRDEAIALNSLLDVDPANPQVPIMAKHVADKLKQRTWFNTQESSFSLLAIGKLAKAAAKATVTADIKVNGKSVGKSNGQVLKLNAGQLKGTNIEIATKGEGRLYYFWQSEGISASGDFIEEDKFLKVRKKFFDRNGKPITGRLFQQNDLVIVEIVLEKAFGGTVENIVITDMLPAGFEIENPRTREMPGMEWIKNAATPTSLDVRDDRINLFVDLNNSRQVYYYAVRAVTPGVYRMGPVSADAMYNGEYHSYNGGGSIEIKQ
jgi:uncharacterized protein YfaS (alpha-2-macroglobulin family)